MEEITISEIPDEIDTKDVMIDQGHCFINSYNVATKYNSVNIVEGIIIGSIKDRGVFKITPHVWNKKNEIHFDVTSEKVWKSSGKMIDSAEIKYVMVKIHNYNDFKDRKAFEFSDETNQRVEAFKTVYQEYGKNKNVD